MNIKYFSFVFLLTCACQMAVKQEKVKDQGLDIQMKVSPQNTSPDYINKAYVMGDFDPEKHPMFVEVNESHADKAGRMLHKDSYAAFVKMHAAAQQAGIDLKIISATRNFNYQKGIWERKWEGKTLLEGRINAATEIADDFSRAKAILKYSSMPGTSRHHWGTDIDINRLTNAYFKSGQGEKEYNWLLKNAGAFGFCQVYTDKSTSNRTGYEEERWHWSYLPIAQHCQSVADQYVNNSDIKGFKGFEQAVKLDAKRNYIFGIDKSCL